MRIFYIHFFAIPIARLISFKVAIPVEKIIGFFNFDASAMSGVLLNKPEEILIADTFIFFSFSNEVNSPGVEKNSIFFVS